MKFPSIFRVNQPRRFQISPRHYDPVKEEISDRTERIRRELEEQGVLTPEKGQGKKLSSRYGSSIRGAFTQGSPIKKQPSSIFQSAGLLRLIIFFFLIGGFGGYLYIGPEVFYYGLYLAVGVALLVGLFKLKSKRKR